MEGLSEAKGTWPPPFADPCAHRKCDELPVDSGLSRLSRVRLPGNGTNAVKQLSGPQLRREG
jgi:hypothetical protein